MHAFEMNRLDWVDLQTHLGQKNINVFSFQNTFHDTQNTAVLTTRIEPESTLQMVEVGLQVALQMMFQDKLCFDKIRYPFGGILIPVLARVVTHVSLLLLDAV